MKKTILPFYQSNFSKTLVSSILIGILFIQQVTAMPSISGSDPLSLVEVSPQKPRAFAYIMQNSLVMRVHLENPAKEKVSIKIFNSCNDLVYQVYLSKRGVYVGKYNLQELSNGDYTLVIKSASYRYSKSFSLQTSIKREVKLQGDALPTVKQESI